MEKKLYRVLVSWTDSADVYVYADSFEQAGERAACLVENGAAHYELDQSNASGFEAGDMVECPTDASDADVKNAEENDEAWKEYAEIDEDPV